MRSYFFITLVDTNKTPDLYSVILPHSQASIHAVQDVTVMECAKSVRVNTKHTTETAILKLVLFAHEENALNAMEKQNAPVATIPALNHNVSDRCRRDRFLLES